MTKLSQHDIDDRNKYLEEAKSLDFLNAVFCIHFYNTDVKRWGPKPKPEDISPNEIFNNYDQKAFNQSIKKCVKLIHDGRKLGDLALNKVIDEKKYQQENELFHQNNVGFNQKNLGRALMSGMRDMR